LTEGLGHVASRVEALLFAAAEPVGLARLAAVAGFPEALVRRALAELAAHLDADGHGITLAETAGGLQLLTRPEHGDAVAALAAPRQPPLSRAALEALAIVAFRQPVTRAAVDELRGVHSEGALSTLLERGLIAEAGRAEAPGRPILYATTRRFLEHFGLRSLEELPRGGAAAPLPALQRLLPPGDGHGAPQGEVR
jgi:segregation and condensation protein B